METDETAYRWSDVRLIFSFSIFDETGTNSVEGDKLQLLLTIGDYGTLAEAVEVLNISYRKAWGDLQKLEKLMGVPLLIRSRGGSGGGRSILTEDGKLLVKAFKELLAEHNNAVNEMVIKFKRTLKNG